MDDIPFDQLKIGLYDLAYYTEGLWSCDFTLSLYESAEVALWAVFSYDVGIVCC
jgi:hypothetical protein